MDRPKINTDIPQKLGLFAYAFTKITSKLTLIEVLKSSCIARAEKDSEPKVPKKRGPKPKVKLDENGQPIEPSTETKTKRYFFLFVSSRKTSF